MRRISCRVVITLGATLAILAGDRAWAAVQVMSIDSFEAPFQLINLSGQSGTASLTNPTAEAGILGGFRAVTLSVLDNPAAQFAQLRAGIYGAARVDTGPDVASSMSVRWDGDGAGLGGIDLTGGGYANAFLMSLRSFDSDLQLGLSIRDTLGAAVSYSRSGLIASDIAFDFAHYAGVDLRSVDAIELELNGPLAMDAAIRSLESVYVARSTETAQTLPEPSSLLALGLMGLVVAGGAAVRRRRRA